MPSENKPTPESEEEIQPEQEQAPEEDIQPEQEKALEAENQPEQEQAPEEDIKSRVEISKRDKKFLKESLTRFTSCGRCSLFLAAYRLNHDDAEMLKAVNNIKGGWIALPWDPGVRDLINKSYGCRIDMQAFYFESCCPDCQGPISYSEPGDDQPNSLRVKM